MGDETECILSKFVENCAKQLISQEVVLLFTGTLTEQWSMLLGEIVVSLSLEI